MIDTGDRVVVGLSGGADSVALFLLLNELKEEFKLKLYAVHINHGIREEADEDADYAESLCEQFHVPFFLFKEDIKALAKMQGKSEEEMGREYRYQCFFEIMEKEKAEKLAVAHHMDDCAETVLFHLLRGTDLSGMTGIRPVNGKIIRPLLNCRKEELTAWLKEKNVTWKEDVTNLENVYARNKIRNQVLPLLSDLNSQAVKHITEFADSMKEYETFFHNMTLQYVNKYVEFVGEDEARLCCTDCKHLISQEKIFATAVIYEMLAKVCGKKKDLTREHILSIYELLNKQSGKRVDLPHQMEAEISYENLIIRKCSKQKEIDICWKKEISLEGLKAGKEKQMQIVLPYGGSLTMKIRSNAEGNLKNNYTKFFDCDKIGNTLCLRTPEQEDYFAINENGNRKKLSRYFIDEKIPLSERRKKLVVAVDHEVLWLIGGRRSESYKINEDTESVLVLIYGGENDEISH